MDKIILDCNKPHEVFDLLFNKCIKVKGNFLRGSRTYETNNPKSDYDMGIIVDDDTIIIDKEGVFENEKSDMRIHPVTWKNRDMEIVRESDFIDMINEHQPFAIEPLMLTENIDNYKSYLNIDTWKLRCRFGQISNNSWSKAKKKMTVEKDLDEYCGVKSLFHSIRLLMFSCFFTKGYITKDERNEVKELYYDILSDWKIGFKWDDFKTKYKPIYNKWHSEVVKMCPKPEEEFKNNKK